MYVTYERKKTNISGIQKIIFNFHDTGKYYTIPEENFEFTNLYSKEAYLHSLDNIEDNCLLISGKNPKVLNLYSNQIYEFFDENKNHYNYTYIIKDTCEPKSFFLFVKELQLIFLMKEKLPNSISKFKNLIENISEKKLPKDQLNLTQWFVENLNENLSLVDLHYLNANNNFGEIISVQMNSLKNLILINSTDRILRLFKYDYDSITLYQDYFDSVNRKKWLNAYFYTLKVNNSYQDLIVTALSDVNSLEFILIDIETGNFIKRLEPFKYQCSNFICHYLNHFTLVLISNKKLFNIIGYLVNNWGAFAPKLKYIEENIEFIEEESFFDDFNKKLKNPPNKTTNKKLIKSIFSHNENTRGGSANTFFRYSPIEDDPISNQSHKDMNEVFQNFNEMVEIHKLV